MTKLKELQTIIKQQAQDIRKFRLEFKEAQRERKPNVWRMQYTLDEMKRSNRHHHIAYSELRGRTRDEIEQPHEDNLPNESAIRAIKDKYVQDVCTSEA